MGRAAEIELFRQALREEPPFSVLFVYGPGGIGKTALLGEYARLAREAGRLTVQLDGHDIQASPHGFAVALSAALGIREGEDPVAALAGSPGPVLLIDTFENIESLDGWLRERLLPLLPADSIVVIAGRNAPSDAWRSDPGWADLSRVISLRNLRPEECRALLTARGVPRERHDDIFRLTHGHPLALTLAAEAGQEREIAANLVGAGPELLRPLVRRFVSTAPSTLHRRALEAASVAYRTTEATLAAALHLEDEGVARQLFEWMRGLSIVEEGPLGLFPHDIVRDAVYEDLRLRDPEQVRTLSRRIARLEANRFLRSGGTERHAAFWGMMYVRRHLSVVGPFYDWEAMGQAFVEPAKPKDRDGIVAMVERHEGAESAEVASRWFSEQPEAFQVFRSLRGEPAGFACHLVVESPDARSFDPAFAAIEDYVRRHAPLRAGERISVHRYWMMREDYQSATAHNTTAPAAVALWMTTPRLAWSFVVLRDIDFWLPHFAFIGFERSREAEFSLGGHRYGMVGHDWRSEPPAAWWAATGRRYHGGGEDLRVPRGEADVFDVLSEPEFRDAVRRAYRDFTRPDALGSSPLLRSRLVAQQAESASPEETLRALLREAVESLSGHPRDQKLYRALWHTYIEPAPTQEAAAEALDVPFSTYRRHLSAGLERATDWLWRREVYGPGGG
ncbi:MAG TPA: AAA family ATPase [Dehalococcoidia bacterium]|nr:AAA family ATPase [Dehalococcoidia bacterium]